ncbi:MAG TPA: undecaprenyl-diphosphate phosphatase [Sandaracinaceae bacterium]
MAGSIDMLTAVVLGAVQGVTEFLPISSDGHIALGAMLFGVSDEMPLAMVVLLHVGTLVATVAVFWPDLVALAKSAASGARAPRAFLETDDGKLLLGIAAASVPTAVIGLVLEGRVEGWARVPWIVGACLLASACAVLSTRRGGGRAEVPTAPQALLIGVAQGLAVMPGLSRSGSTIAVAMLLGMSGPAAFRFSFLLSLPAIFGATLLQARHTEELARLGAPALAGAATALVVGYVALRLLRAIVRQGRFWTFALYLIPLGLGILVWDLAR